MNKPWYVAAAVLLLNIPFWLAYAAMVGVLYVVGVPLIWWAARKHRTNAEPSVVWPGKLIYRWRREWMNPVWGNEQDGVNGVPVWQKPSLSWWPDYYAKHGFAKTVFQWSALRNSTNNLRFMHYFVPWLGWINPRGIAPERIEFWSRGRFTLTWQGAYAGITAYFNRNGLRHRFMLGWKLHPGMSDPAWWPDDPCWKGVGFTCGSIRRVES